MTSKKCNMCGEYKNINLFYKNKNHSDGYQNNCIVCDKKYQKRRNAQSNKNLREYINTRTNMCCELCGEYFNSTSVFDFHHIIPENKLFNLSNKKWTGIKGPSKKTIEEAEKCAILCANCHRLEHEALRKGGSLLHETSSVRLRSEWFKPNKNMGTISEGIR